MFSALHAWIMLLAPFAYAEHKCVWVHGAVRCHKDPSRNLNVEVRVYDRDGLSLAKLIDPDDLMGLVHASFAASERNTVVLRQQ